MIRATLERTTSSGSMWDLAAKAKILASQHFANLHRIKFPLHSMFFQNNSFFMGNEMDTGRQEQWYCSGLTLSYQKALKIFRKGRRYSLSRLRRHWIVSLFVVGVLPTGAVLDRIFILVVSNPSILPIWPLLLISL